MEGCMYEVTTANLLLKSQRERLDRSYNEDLSHDNGASKCKINFENFEKIN